MNKRIKELAEQCATPERFDVAKFAELIVRECANHIMTSSDRYRKDYFAHKILEHFGVEE